MEAAMGRFAKVQCTFALIDEVRTHHKLVELNPSIKKLHMHSQSEMTTCSFTANHAAWCCTMIHDTKSSLVLVFLKASDWYALVYDCG